MTAPARTVLMTPTRVRRTLDRLAYEVIERNRGGDVLVFGIRSRGTVLAHRLAAIIAAETGATPPVTHLDVRAYRDDRTDDFAVELGGAITSGWDVTDRDVVLVDDVLFTGRTARAAIEAVLAHGRPRSIQLVVLVDRGHREYPIQPDFVGAVIPTKHTERVVVEGEGDETHVFLDD
ncbi:MAG: bifunctional pyr operon transcriptional regulator/uracil phosphoribosyltransferase PyrR [Bacteroidota bacterium]